MHEAEVASTSSQSRSFNSFASYKWERIQSSSMCWCDTCIQYLLRGIPHDRPHYIRTGTAYRFVDSTSNHKWYAVQWYNRSKRRWSFYRPCTAWFPAVESSIDGRYWPPLRSVTRQCPSQEALKNNFQSSQCLCPCCTTANDARRLCQICSFQIWFRTDSGLLENMEIYNGLQCASAFYFMIFCIVLSTRASTFITYLRRFLNFSAIMKRFSLRLSLPLTCTKWTKWAGLTSITDRIVISRNREWKQRR